MRLSLAICTYNRSRLLRRALDSLTRAIVPAGISWEIIVVDNASDDDTAAVAESFRDALPLACVREAAIGLSHARNTAVRCATGEYVLWLDDDVIVDRGWLQAYVAAFSRWPSAAFFGGPIVPRFEGEPPRWLPRAMTHLGNAFSALDLGRDAREFNTEALPYGANLVIRMMEQRRHAYDSRLGRRGASLFAGEEWAVLHALLAEGAHGRWVPEARVEHIIPPARQTVRYLRRYYRGNGASEAVMSDGPGVRKLFGRPRWAWRAAVTHELAYRWRRLYAPPDVWSLHLKRASVAWGIVLPPKATR